MGEVRLSGVERKFLEALRVEPRDNRWVQAHFGIGHAYFLARRGLVKNPLVEQEHAHTNLWMLTAKGLSVLQEGVR